MKVLIIGSGGREHALAWKVAQSPLVSQIYVAPGNAGTATELKTQNIDIDAANINALCDFAKQHTIDLTIVGPEAALAAGIVDLFSEHGLACFGPNQQAAQLEASKIFAKDFLAKYKIPTAKYATFTNFAEALDHVQKQTFPIVIKADGLAAGKGVLVAQKPAEAIEWLTSVFKDNRFGAAGRKVVFEEFLTGEEASYIIITDGEYIIPLPTSQDHKARDNGDKGPNTGGMGAYSPAGLITPKIEKKILDNIVTPTLVGLRKEGIKYNGFLYVGLMIDKKGEPSVLEYNCRLGDPETQPLLMRLESDLIPILNACLTGKLGDASLEISQEAALTVVMCAGGYPGKYPKGHIITGLTNQTEPAKVFHAGTKLEGDNVITNGGRVLGVSVRAEDLITAQYLAYEAIAQIHWDDCYYRTDIGYKEIAKLQEG